MSGVEWGALVSLAIFIMTHIGITVWWASRVNTLLGFVQTELREIVAELKASRSTYMTKDEFTYYCAQADKEHVAMWKRIDEVRTHLHG